MKPSGVRASTYLAARLGLLACFAGSLVIAHYLYIGSVLP
jgi:hypothetical protein